MKKSNALILYALLTITAVLFFLPFLWMVSSSLKKSEDIFRVPPTFFPSAFEIKNYRGALTAIPFLRYTMNTTFVCAMNVIGNVLSASLVAYSLGVLRWRGRNALFMLLLASMLLPPQVTMIPVFIIWRKLHLVDTYAPLIVPAFFGTPFFIFLLRQFFLGIPRDLVEAARIDGCSEWRIYWQVIAPLAKPALGTVALFAFFWTWTDFMTPLIYLQDQKLFTLSLGLQQFQETHNAQWGNLMAASTLMTIPMIIVFFFAQKTFVQGIATTGLK
ncbi:carbohydrate ABC transporter permease [soil metagenome]